MPFLKALKLLGKTFQWDEGCIKVLNDLKDYMTKLPLLCAPIPGETLYLYLLMSEQVIAPALIREAETKQKPIYFVSRILHDADVRYFHIENLVYALVITTRKLRAYFKSYPIIVYTNYLLKQFFHKLNQPGRMLR